MSDTTEYFVDDEQFENALIRRCKLSQAQVRKIHEVQLEQSIGFAEAALRLDAVTQADVDFARGGSARVATLDKHRLHAGPELLIAHEPFHDHSERVRVLRTELLLRRESGGRNAIAVMSPRSGEGRSRLAAELAIAFSQLGQPTLLVDADLRSPRQHRLFGTDGEEGLMQAIADRAPPHLYSVHNLPHLSVLMAGAPANNPVELLSDGRFELLTKQWRRRYKHIVIDTSPVSEYSDALAVATLIGRVMLVTRAGHTPYKATREMLRRLQAAQAHVVGAVVNHF